MAKHSIDKLFADTLQDLEKQTSPEAWDKVAQQWDKQQKIRRLKVLSLPALAASFLIAALVWVMPQEDSSSQAQEQKPAKKNNPKVIIEDFSKRQNASTPLSQESKNGSSISSEWDKLFPKKTIKKSKHLVKQSPLNKQKATSLKDSLQSPKEPPTWLQHFDPSSKRSIASHSQETEEEEIPEITVTIKIKGKPKKKIRAWQKTLAKAKKLLRSEEPLAKELGLDNLLKKRK